MAGKLVVSTLNNDTGVLATQNGMTGIAKAWLLYNQAAQSILGSFNISSVTYSSAGVFIVNFATAMPSANYSVLASANRYAQGATNQTPMIAGVQGSSYTTGSITINVGWQPTDTLYTTERVNVAVFA